MGCFMCKGSIEDKLTTFMVDVENCIVVVKNVPHRCVHSAVIHHIPIALPHALKKLLAQQGLR